MTIGDRAQEQIQYWMNNPLGALQAETDRGINQALVAGQVLATKGIAELQSHLPEGEGRDAIIGALTQGVQLLSVVLGKKIDELLKMTERELLEMLAKMAPSQLATASAAISLAGEGLAAILPWIAIVVDLFTSVLDAPGEAQRMTEGDLYRFWNQRRQLRASWTGPDGRPRVSALILNGPRIGVLASQRQSFGQHDESGIELLEMRWAGESPEWKVDVPEWARDSFRLGLADAGFSGIDDARALLINVENIIPNILSSAQLVENWALQFNTASAPSPRENALLGVYQTHVAGAAAALAKHGVLPKAAALIGALTLPYGTTRPFLSSLKNDIAIGLRNAVIARRFMSGSITIPSKIL